MLVAACGRGGFDPVPDSTPGGSADATTDPCAAGDGQCLAQCVGTDPDCDTTCGDGKCVGNNGESCTECAADCATQVKVCGNGVCEAGEQTTCFIDCGPDPWTWVSEETSMLAAVNAARTNGTTCPGSGSPTTAPALVLDPTLTQPARDWAWQIGHDGFYMADASACNGESFTQRSNQGDYVTALSGYSFGSGAAAANFFITDTASCPTLMDSSRTAVGVGVALDGQRGFVLVMR
jgi:hypothetical protein